MGTRATKRYWYARCPKGTPSKYELLVFFDYQEVHLPLSDYYADCSKQLSERSAISYLSSLLPFFTWLRHHSNYQGRNVNWDDEPEIIRSAIEDYLMNDMNCKLRQWDTFYFVNLTNKSPNTVNRFLSALKSFYKTMIAHNRRYKYPNPLIDSKAILNDYTSVSGERDGKPRMPQQAGTETPLQTRRLTDSYFKLINQEWQPIVISDPHLPFNVYRAGDAVKWSEREMVIARMMFETGARVSEIIGLTIGDYRNRKDHNEVSTFSKGSFQVRTKWLRFSSDVAKRLLAYVNGERSQYDPNGLRYKQLPDDAPLFLTEDGSPFTYNAWSYHWNRAMNKAELDINPHKARHWFVTNRLREIYKTASSEAEITQERIKLQKYMKWKNADTMDVYTHLFEESEMRQQHDQMTKKMQQEEQEYMKNISKKRKTKPAKKMQDTPSNNDWNDEYKDFWDAQK